MEEQSKAQPLNDDVAPPINTEEQEQPAEELVLKEPTPNVENPSEQEETAVGEDGAQQEGDVDIEEVQSDAEIARGISAGSNISKDLQELRDIPEDHGPSSRATPSSPTGSATAALDTRGGSSQSSHDYFDETLKKSAIAHIRRDTIEEHDSEGAQRASYPDFKRFMPAHQARVAAKTPLVCRFPRHGSHLPGSGMDIRIQLQRRGRCPCAG